MRCSSCQNDNQDGARFCAECGQPLAAVCSQCQTANPAGAKFCSQCGTPTGAGAPTPAPAAPKPPETGGAERRQLTVMFCDIVGSTALSEELDPEDFRALVDVYQKAAAAAIEPYDGYIAQYYGDGLLIYFGYPVAHEDDAVRAVKAGLQIIGAMGTMPRPLQVRIGIHTGNVVAGEVGAGTRRDQLAIGQTPNLAAHIQGLAQTNTVAVSETTYKLAEGHFNFEPLGPQELKGTSKPVLVYRALEESGVHGRFELNVQRGLSTLVGRDEEMALLSEKMRQSMDGHGQAVLVMAEAGVGKSRLIHSFREKFRKELSNWWVYRCTPYTQNTSFYPVIEMIYEQISLEDTDSDADKIAKIEKRCDAFGLPRDEIVPLTAALISTPLGDRYPPLNLSPELFKERVLAFFTEFILARAKELPVVFFMEDLHWIDPSTMEFLERLLGRAGKARLLILFSARPEFQSPWHERPDVTTLELERLGREHIGALIRELTGGHKLAPVLEAHLVDKCDGVPLYVEEMTKSLLDMGLIVLKNGQYEMAEGQSALAIPTTLRDSLTARLDQLGAAKGVAQLGSALGREFSFNLLSAVSPDDMTTLQNGVDRVVDAELLFRRDEGFHTVYSFKHALIQDAAHLSLLRSQRQAIHEHIAKVLAERFPKVARTQPELMAYHYEQAQDYDEAARFLVLAAQQAMSRSAYAESVSHCEKGLGLLDKMPRTPAVIERELALRGTMGVGLIVTRGYAAEAVAANSERSQAACAELGDTPALIPSLYGLWVYHLLRGHRDQSFEVSQRIHDTVKDEPAHRLIGYSSMGTTAFFAGRLVEAKEHYEAAMDIYKPEMHATLAQTFGDDSGLLPHFYHFWCEWLLGDPEAAIARKEAVMKIVEDLGSPYVLTTGLFFEMILWHALRDTDKMREIAERLHAIAQEQRYVFFECLANVGCGWLLHLDGKIDESIERMQGGLAVHAAIGTRLPRSYWLIYLIEVLLSDGRTDEATEVVTEALELTSKQLDVYYDAELHRLRGELLVQAGKPDEAEAAYKRALELAEETGAVVFALRAATALARLCSTQGRGNEGRAQLEAVESRYPAGVDIPDLAEARALLLQLA